MSRSKRFGRPHVGIALLALILAIGAVMVARQTQIDREIRHLPDSQRTALYQRTLETLRSPCSHAGGDALSDFCREQAEFIQRFPECDDACRELAALYRPLHVR